MTSCTHCPTLHLPAVAVLPQTSLAQRLRQWFQRRAPVSDHSPLPALSAHLLRDLNLHENGSAGLGLERELARLEQQTAQMLTRHF